MRIIAGQWRGRRLLPPPDTSTRPTAERTREALFSILTSRLGSFEGLTILDAFAGTGALGLEALSRGAAHCTFIEASPTAARICAANITALAAQPRARILTSPVERAGPAPQPVDVALLDPPYGLSLAAPALAHLAAQGWIGPATLVSVETGAAEPLAAPGFAPLLARRHGRARLNLLRLA